MRTREHHGDNQPKQKSIVSSRTDPALLAAVLNRILPGADRMPTAADADVAAYLETNAAGDHAPWWPLITEGLDGLGPDFATADAQEQDRRLRRIEHEDWFTALVDLATEGYLAPRGSQSWTGMGYDEGAKRSPDAPVRFTQPAVEPFENIGEDPYDVVIIGSGAGGGIAAKVLADAGLRVLVVERGRLLRYEDSNLDHLRNNRLARYGQTTGPDAPDPRQVVSTVGVSRVIDKPWQAGWLNNAMVVGGGTRVYQGMAWRLQPEDFRLASIYGVPTGSSLADWPITYDELEPYYTQAEWEIGVCGDGTSHSIQGPRSAEYPMPPLPSNPEAEALDKGARTLGWSTGPVPLLINSVPRDGRARCVGCGHCVGFPCPSDAKNGTFNTALATAVATGRCRLVTEVRATHLITNSEGSAGAVQLLDLRSGTQRRVQAGHVVLAASAIESARLLLDAGIGTAADQVGRHLQGHLYVGTYGLFPNQVVDGVGPGVRIATCDHYYGPNGVLGGVIANEVVKWPILHRLWAYRPDAPTWGQAALEALRDEYLRTTQMNGPVQEVPQPTSRVSLSKTLDRWGSPVVRLEGDLHPETVRAAGWLQDRQVEWLEASGARPIWRTPIVNQLTAGQHQAGTCRMGDDPATSVTDRWGRVHGQRNLWVMDGGVHVTNGGVNPVLTIMALAFRNAEHLAQQ